MKTSFILFLLLAVFASAGLGATLSPVLKAQAEQFDKARIALTAASDAQVAPARDRYIAVLTAARTTATAAGKTADLAAITTELEGVQAGALPPEAPADLLRSLAGDRRGYVSAAANAARTTAPRQRDLATRYFQSLAALEAGPGRIQDPALAEAIAGEKQRVLALLEASGGGTKHRNIVANGDFSQGEDGAAPPGWKKDTEVTVSDALILSEGTNKFLRFRRLEALRRANLMPEKEIPVPANAKGAEISLRIRVKGLVPGTVWNTHPGVQLSGRDGRDKEVSKLALEAKTDTGWRRLSGRLELPAGAKTLKVAIGPHGAAGIIDFDEVEVQFR